MELFRNVIANENWIKRQKSCRLFQSETKDQPEATPCVPFVTKLSLQYLNKQRKCKIFTIIANIPLQSFLLVAKIKQTRPGVDKRKCTNYGFG